jgi:DNA polymerase-3 subunit gamma/tau
MEAGKKKHPQGAADEVPGRNAKYAQGPEGEPEKNEKAKLIVQTAREEIPAGGKKAVGTQQPEQASSKTATATETPTLGALSKIRQQFANRQNNGNANALKPLAVETLQEAWQQFTRQLQANRNPAVQSFQRAVLKITDQSSFEVVSNNNLEQKFIEQEKRNLSDYLQQVFNNKTLSFIISISETNAVAEPAEKVLTKRDQYLQIIEQYPLVKELKDRLKLELDY